MSAPIVGHPAAQRHAHGALTESRAKYNYMGVRLPLALAVAIALGLTWHRHTQKNDEFAERFLLVTPCDPGDCHIYFGVQRQAFTTAIALALATQRTLLLPPIEWYRGQAQTDTNSFKRSRHGRTPLFTRWSDLYDLDLLRAAGIRCLEYHNANELQFDRALLQTGYRLGMRRARETQGALAGRLLNWRCVPGSQPGLLANLSRSSWPFSRRNELTGQLYGRETNFASLQCGHLPLNADGTGAALRAWLGDSRLAAIFNVGHLLSVRYEDSASRELVERGALQPSARLVREAERFIGKALRGRRFVAAHWRHGDFASYGTATSSTEMVRRIRHAMEEAACKGCLIFLMSNCKNESLLDELRDAAPSALKTYTPSTPQFSTEGTRLLIEQAIAARAMRFVASKRSSVSEYVKLLRRARLVAQSLLGD